MLGNPAPALLPWPWISKIPKSFRKRFLARRMLLVGLSWRAAMSTVQLNSTQRRKLRIQLRCAEGASYYRRLLAILELDRGKSVASVAAALGVTGESIHNLV